MPRSIPLYQFWFNRAKEFSVSERRVALVEDTVKTLDEVARKTGCTTVHVSSFFFA